ncbi:MAG: L-threonylcarbamoyladenylate synthase [Bacteroides sp.]|nr:L-threonylcarbamoyladenylate synthase [Bacteroides sp.]
MIIKLYDGNNNYKQIEKIVEVIENGGVIITPTDTVYALCCHALKEKAVEKICKIKGIDTRKKHLSIVCNSLSAVSSYAKINNDIFKLIKRNTPGAFTFILEGTNKLPKIMRGRKEIGVRIPDNNIIKEISEMLQAPLMTTSLTYNEGEEIEYITNPQLIEEKYGNVVELVIDGGVVDDVQYSTIVDCTTDEIEIIRQGKGELV